MQAFYYGCIVNLTADKVNMKSNYLKHLAV